MDSNAVLPGAPEIAMADHNCDGAVDGFHQQVYYLDAMATDCDDVDCW